MMLKRAHVIGYFIAPLTGKCDCGGGGFWWLFDMITLPCYRK